jgi:hypothetical protein
MHAAQGVPTKADSTPAGLRAATAVHSFVHKSQRASARGATLSRVVCTHLASDAGQSLFLGGDRQVRGSLGRRGGVRVLGGLALLRLGVRVLAQQQVHVLPRLRAHHVALRLHHRWSVTHTHTHTSRQAHVSFALYFACKGCMAEDAHLLPDLFFLLLLLVHSLVVPVARVIPTALRRRKVEIINVLSAPHFARLPVLRQRRLQINRRHHACIERALH